MKEKNKLIIAIIAVVLIIIVVIGATYAYWQWTTNSAQQTTVTFTVPNKNDLLSASLAGGGTSTVSNLAPAACTNGTYAFKKQITLTYKNLTTEAAAIKGTLTVSNWTQPHTGTLRLNKLHYALTDNETSCTTATVLAGGSNSTFVTSGALINEVTFLTVPANTASGSDDFWLWVWIDSTDSGSNSGSTVSDPMQDLTFTLTWTGEIANVTR